MSILVTGANGGFGRLFAQWLRQHASEPVWHTDIADKDDDLYLKCDMRDADAIRAVIKQVLPQRIFHFAGCFSNLYDVDYPVNALSARHICETLLTERSETRLILIGSAAEYGVVLLNPVTRRIVSNCPYDEDAVLLTPRELQDVLCQAALRPLHNP